MVKTYSYDAFGVEQNPSDSDTNPFRYCGEYYDSEIEQIYLRARYYDPSLGRFTQQDPAMSGANWYVYCSNNPVNYTDPMGLWESGDENLSREAQEYIKYYTNGWIEADQDSQNAASDEEFANAERRKDYYHAAANDIRELDAAGRVSGNVYDVQVFMQGDLQLCWAYSQVMVENYNSGTVMTQSEADERAQTIAESVYGKGYFVDGKAVWDRGGWPTNLPPWSGDSPTIYPIGSFDDLSASLSNGPIYAYYTNGYPEGHKKAAAHLIVATGVASAPGHPGLVTSNNPWGYENIQTYNDFMVGIPYDESDPPMEFYGVLIPQ